MSFGTKNIDENKEVVKTVIIELEILLLLTGKSHRICPAIILKIAKSIVSEPLIEIMNNSVLEGVYLDKLKMAKVVPILEAVRTLNLTIIVRFHSFP